ncbi:hypothetical protein PENTCL1PPCAC_21746, partial [Pristionchus entomophagus]
MWSCRQWMRLLTSLNGVTGGEKIGLLVGVPSMGGVEAEEEMMAYANVVTYALSLSQSGSTASGRSKHLPELLRRILICANSMNVIEKGDRMVLSTVDMAAGLLAEISRASPLLPLTEPSDEAAAAAATPESLNKAFLASLVD